MSCCASPGSRCCRCAGWARRRFRADGGTRLLAGNALHADISPGDGARRGVRVGALLAGPGSRLSGAEPAGRADHRRRWCARLRGSGGEVRCGRAGDGDRGAAADAPGRCARPRRALPRRPRGDRRRRRAPALSRAARPDAPVPAALLRELDHFQYDNATFKVDWTLDGPIPWQAARARAAGTVHVAEGIDALTLQSAELACRLIPGEPYLVMGQYASFDPSRAPGGQGGRVGLHPCAAGGPRDAGGRADRALGRAGDRACSPSGSRSRSRRWRPASAR